MIIRLGGQVEKRKKKLSKAVYGTSHTISLAEAEHIHRRWSGCSLARASTAGWRCRRRRPPTSPPTAARWSLLPTLEVIPVWNQAQGAVIGLVHVTR